MRLPVVLSGKIMRSVSIVEMLVGGYRFPRQRDDRYHLVFMLFVWGMRAIAICP
jgi:hypothetical protein